MADIDEQMAEWRSTYMRQDNPQKLAKIERYLGMVRDRVGSGTLLDVGCGCGEVYKYLGLPNYHGIDVDAFEIDRAKASCPDGSFALGDMFEDLGEWDFVLCSRVLIHVPLDAAIRSLLKATKKALFLILSVGPDNLEVEAEGKTFFRTVSRRVLDSYGQYEIQTLPRHNYSLVTYER